DDGEAGDDGVRVEEVPEGAGEVAVRVERHAVQERGEADAPDERRAEAPERVRPHPGRAPARARAPLAPLERDDADDQADEHEQQRDVETGERPGVPGGKAGEG